MNLVIALPDTSTNFQELEFVSNLSDNSLLAYSVESQNPSDENNGFWNALRTTADRLDDVLGRLAD